MARLEECAIQTSYRVYIADSIHLRGQNKHLTKRWSEIIADDNFDDGRTGDEIAEDIIKRHGLKVKSK